MYLSKAILVCPICEWHNRSSLHHDFQETVILTGLRILVGSGVLVVSLFPKIEITSALRDRCLDAVLPTRVREAATDLR